MSLSADTSLTSIWQVLLGLILVMGLMVAAAWALKRFQSLQMREGAIIKVLGGVNVGPRERIMVVEVADQWLVVGVTSGRLDALATLQKKEIPQSEPNKPTDKGGFSSRLESRIAARDEA